MNKKQTLVIKSIMGESFLEKLEKAELYNPATKTTVDTNEVKVALQIVPRCILTWLISELKPMKPKDIKDLQIPWEAATLHVEKLAADVYSGEIISNEGKKIYEYKYRSLPSVGLIILSTFELYDMSEELSEQPAQELPQEETQIIIHTPDNQEAKLQQLIDDRFQLNNIIRNVVDQRISEREAMQQMLLMRLAPVVTIESELQKPQEAPMDKKLKLKEFLEQRKSKLEQPQPEEVLDKKEGIDCPDCKTSLYKSGDTSIKCCICYGEFRNKNIRFEKTEKGVKFKFPKSFSVDNIEMILEAIKGKK